MTGEPCLLNSCDLFKAAPVAGLIIVKQDFDIGAAMEDLLLIWAAADA